MIGELFNAMADEAFGPDGRRVMSAPYKMFKLDAGFNMVAQVGAAVAKYPTIPSMMNAPAPVLAFTPPGFG